MDVVLRKLVAVTMVRVVGNILGTADYDLDMNYFVDQTFFICDVFLISLFFWFSCIFLFLES